MAGASIREQSQNSQRRAAVSRDRVDQGNKRHRKHAIAPIDHARTHARTHDADLMVAAAT
jgi:hypothetical protein